MELLSNAGTGPDPWTINTSVFTQTHTSETSSGGQSEGPLGWGCSQGAGRGGGRGGPTFQVFVQDVLEAVEDGFVVLDFVALAGVRPLLPALEVGVDLTGVGGVLFVVGHLETETQRSH